MATKAVEQPKVPQAGPFLIGLVRENGSFSHPWVSSEALLAGPESPRNLADAIHFLCLLHGRFPGAIELAALRTAEPWARPWLGEASEAFAHERGLLARLAVAAGPVPATPGTGSEAAIAVQRGAIATLAQSERRGCAIGAALGLAADWSAVRTILDAAALRFDVPAAPNPFADPAPIVDLADTGAESPAVRRALMFGAEQVALQHRGLWDLLQARAEARAAL